MSPEKASLAADLGSAFILFSEGQRTPRFVRVPGPANYVGHSTSTRVPKRGAVFSSFLTYSNFPLSQGLAPLPPTSSFCGFAGAAPESMSSGPEIAQAAASAV